MNGWSVSIIIRSFLQFRFTGSIMIYPFKDSISPFNILNNVVDVHY